MAWIRRAISSQPIFSFASLWSVVRGGREAPFRASLLRLVVHFVVVFSRVNQRRAGTIEDMGALIYTGCSVKLDVRDLGGHLDITCRARASTLAAPVRMVVGEVAAVGALPFSFKAKLGCIPSKFTVGLHGVEVVRACYVFVFFARGHCSSSWCFTETVGCPQGVSFSSMWSGLGFVSCVVTLPP